MSERTDFLPAPTERRILNGPQPDRLLTAEELGHRWQLPSGAVYRLTRSGDIPAVKLGRYYRYRLAAVEAFEADGGTSQ